MSGTKIIGCLILFLLNISFTPTALAKQREVTVIVQVNLKTVNQAKKVRLWIPYPLSDRNQEVTDIRLKGNYTHLNVLREGRFGNTTLFSEWGGPVQEKTLTYSFRVLRKEVNSLNSPKEESPFSKEEYQEYLELSSFGIDQGRLRDYALKITGDKGTIYEKARAVYDWVVDNMRRDPDVKGCGFGEVDRLMETKAGKCADIHSVFVVLARAAGIPAREIFGIRIPPGQEGQMTKAQHCWAEFYLPGRGWVVVDPADVRKIILEKKLTMDQAAPYREYYFGAVDENRIAFGSGRNIWLNPAQNEGPLNYFMYPYAEADGKPVNEDLYGFNIGYQIGFKER